MNDEHEQPKQPDDPLDIPTGLDRRSKTTKPTVENESPAAPQSDEAEPDRSAENDDSTPASQDDEAKFEDIGVEYDEIDNRCIEGKARQGELLAEARKYLKEQKDWVRFVTKRLGTNLMDVHRKIRCHEAATKVGANKLLQGKLSESAIWHLAAPDVPDEALWEAVEQAQTESVTVGKADQIARKWIKAKGGAVRKLRAAKKLLRPRNEVDFVSGQGSFDRRPSFDILATARQLFELLEWLRFLIVPAAQAIDIPARHHIHVDVANAVARAGQIGAGPQRLVDLAEVVNDPLSPLVTDLRRVVGIGGKALGVGTHHVGRIQHFRHIEERPVT